MSGGESDNDQKDIEGLSVYAGLMTEAKHRLFAIWRAVNDDINLPKIFVQEFCYLQLRMICESIALGCLVAHGDLAFAKTKKALKEYSADRIITMLSELHPDFYPEPINLVLTGDTENGAKSWSVEPVDHEFMTKAELLQLVAKCGSILHRGNLKRIGSGKDLLEPNLDDVHAFAQKIRNLLRVHQTTRLDESTMYVCDLKLEDLEAGALVLIAR